MSSARAAPVRSNRTRAVCWVLLALSGAALAPIQKRIDRHQTRSSGLGGDELYVGSGETLRRLSLGHQGLLADIYWTRAVQYFGRQRLARSEDFKRLGPLLDVTTTLDPHLIIAYRFGAIFLAEKPPGGAGHPEQALQLLRRGIVANPDYWRLWQDLGFIYYWDLKDYASAARWFGAGGERPGALPWMKTLAATVAAKRGDAETSRQLWAELYRQAENDALRRSAEEHLAAFDAQDQIDKLDQALARFRESRGRPARSWQELAAAGLLAGVPKDPSGAPYRIGGDGAAHLGPGSQINLRLVE